MPRKSARKSEEGPRSSGGRVTRSSAKSNSSQKTDGDLDEGGSEKSMSLRPSPSPSSRASRNRNNAAQESNSGHSSRKRQAEEGREPEAAEEGREPEAAEEAAGQSTETKGFPRDKTLTPDKQRQSPQKKKARSDQLDHGKNESKQIKSPRQKKQETEGNEMSKETTNRKRKLPTGGANSVEKKSKADDVSQDDEKQELDDFVVVDFKDVPPSDSDEIKQSIPDKMSQSSSVSTRCNAANDHKSFDVNQLNSDMADRDSDRDPDPDPDCLLNRRLIANPNLDDARCDEDKMFSVVSYNILAECHRQANDYSYTEEKYLNMNYRHDRIIKELAYLDGDVVCLQEVEPDYYSQTLLPAMESLGYESGGFIKRVAEKDDEGEATFYRPSRFTLLETYRIVLREAAEKDLVDSEMKEEVKACARQYLNESSVLLVNKLRCNRTNTEVTIGNIHVVFGYFKIQDVQCVQISNAFRELISIAGGTEHAHILCGDFNSQPDTPGYQLASDGYLNEESIEKLQAIKQVHLPDGSKEALVNLMWNGFKHTSSSIKSSYLTCQGTEPTRSTHNKLLACTVDYVWYSAHCLDVRYVHGCEDLNLNQMMPTKTLPSDHVSLSTKITFI